MREGVWNGAPGDPPGMTLYGSDNNDEREA